MKRRALLCALALTLCGCPQATRIKNSLNLRKSGVTKKAKSSANSTLDHTAESLKTAPKRAANSVERTAGSVKSQVEKAPDKVGRAVTNAKSAAQTAKTKARTAGKKATGALDRAFDRK